MEKEQPFKISIEHYGEKMSIEVPFSDVTLDKAGVMCGKLLLAAGYDQEQVQEMFNTEII